MIAPNMILETTLILVVFPAMYAGNGLTEVRALDVAQRVAAHTEHAAAHGALELARVLHARHQQVARHQA
jgi:hypothetical protein